MISARAFTVLASSLIVIITAGCASIGLTQSLDPQLEQVRALRAQLSADWEAIGSDLDGIESDLAAFGSQRIDTADVDPAVLREAAETIEVPADATVEDVDRAKDQIEARVAAYEKSLEEIDDDARAKVEELRNNGSSLSKRLHEDLPARLADIGERAGGMAEELAEIKVAAEQADALAKNNPLMTDADAAALSQDKATLDREIVALTGLAQEIAAESVEYGGRLAAATTKFDVELSSFGK